MSRFDISIEFSSINKLDEQWIAMNNTKNNKQTLAPDIIFELEFLDVKNVGKFGTKVYYDTN